MLSMSGYSDVPATYCVNEGELIYTQTTTTLILTVTICFDMASTVKRHMRSHGTMHSSTQFSL